jgi:DUF4097 and DUF4098 domain-containing protein YvlB
MTAMFKTFETPAPIDVDVRFGAGTLTLEGVEATSTEVRIDPHDDAGREALESARVELRGNRLVIELPERRGLFGRSPRFDVRVTCPARSRLSARTRSADIQARGTLTGADVKTASGDVEIEQIEGDTSVSSASGAVELGTADGRTSINTASGDVEIGRTSGSLKANLVSGDLTVREAEGPIEAHTVSGDQRLDAVGAGTVASNSVSGDIVVRVRRGATVWMDVRSLSGETTSDLDATEGPPADESKLVELRLNTVSGDISIGRAATAA